MAQQLCVVSIPASDVKPAALFGKLQQAIGADGMNKAYRFDFPALNVGTLDSLMSLSDELVKISVQVEVIIYCNFLKVLLIFCCRMLSVKLNDSILMSPATRQKH